MIPGSTRPSQAGVTSPGPPAVARRPRAGTRGWSPAAVRRHGRPRRPRAAPPAAAASGARRGSAGRRTCAAPARPAGRPTTPAPARGCGRGRRQVPRLDLDRRAPSSGGVPAGVQGDAGPAAGARRHPRRRRPARAAPSRSARQAPTGSSQTERRSRAAWSAASTARPSTASTVSIRPAAGSARPLARGGRRPRAGPGAPRARTAAGPALVSTSCHSSAGVESATTPPPTPSAASPSGADLEACGWSPRGRPGPGERKPAAPVCAPRAAASTPSVTSVARCLGVPVTDPGGNVWTTSAPAPTSARSRPPTRETRWATPVWGRTASSSSTATEPGSHTRARSLRTRSTIMTFSLVSLADAASAPSCPAGRVPLMGEEVTRPPATDR